MRSIVGLLALSLVIAGCGTEAQTLGGRRTERPPSAIVSLSPGTTEIVGAASLNAALKGRTAACDYPEYAVKTVPIVAGVKPDYEKIATIKPDLVLYDGDLYNAQDAEKIKALGAKVLVFEPNSVDEYIEKVGEFAALTGTETTMSSYLDKVEAARTGSLSEPFPQPIRVAVILGGGGGVAYVSGKDGFLASCVKAAGAVPVGPAAKKFVPLDPEVLAAEPPDAIFVPVNPKNATEAQKTLDAVAKDPKLASLPAVRAGKVFPIDGDVALRRGARVDKLIDGMHRALARG